MSVLSHYPSSHLPLSSSRRKRSRVSAFRLPPGYHHKTLPRHPPPASAAAVCPLCFKRFPSLRALGGHMRIHGGYSDAHLATDIQAKKPDSLAGPKKPDSLAGALSHGLVQDDDDDDQEEEEAECGVSAGGEGGRIQARRGSDDTAEDGYQRREAGGDDGDGEEVRKMVPESKEEEEEEMAARPRIKLIFKANQMPEEAMPASFGNQTPRRMTKKPRSDNRIGPKDRKQKRCTRCDQEPHQESAAAAASSSSSDADPAADVLLACEWLLMLKYGKAHRDDDDGDYSMDLDPTPRQQDHVLHDGKHGREFHPPAALSNLNIPATHEHLHSTPTLPHCHVADPTYPVSHISYECMTCNKLFDSSRALGGHRASCHKKRKLATSVPHQNLDHPGILTSRANYGPDAVPSENKPGSHPAYNGNALGHELDITLRTLGSGHCCSICHRVFATGQALGGHKRCHWNGGEHAANDSDLCNVSVLSHLAMATTVTTTSGGQVGDDLHDLSLYPLEEEEEEEEAQELKEEEPNEEESSRPGITHCKAARNLSFDLNCVAPDEDIHDEEVRSSLCHVDELVEETTTARAEESNTSVAADMNAKLLTLMEMQDKSDALSAPL